MAKNLRPIHEIQEEVKKNLAAAQTKKEHTKALRVKRSTLRNAILKDERLDVASRVAKADAFDAFVAGGGVSDLFELEFPKILAQQVASRTVAGPKPIVEL